MSIFIKPSVFKARDDEDEFRGVDVLAETSVQGYLEAIEEKGEETIDSIPSDYTSLVNDVADVKSDLRNKDIKHIGTERALSGTMFGKTWSDPGWTWEQGSYTDSGSKNNSTKYIRVTEDIIFPFDCDVSISMNGYKFIVLKITDQIEKTTLNNTGSITFEKDISYRIYCRNSSLTDITPDVSSNFTYILSAANYTYTVPGDVTDLKTSAVYNKLLSPGNLSNGRWYGGVPTAHPNYIRNTRKFYVLSGTIIHWDYSALDWTFGVYIYETETSTTIIEASGWIAKDYMIKHDGWLSLNFQKDGAAITVGNYDLKVSIEYDPHMVSVTANNVPSIKWIITEINGTTGFISKTSTKYIVSMCFLPKFIRYIIIPSTYSLFVAVYDENGLFVGEMNPDGTINTESYVAQRDRIVDIGKIYAINPRYNIMIQFGNQVASSGDGENLLNALNNLTYVCHYHAFEDQQLHGKLMSFYGDSISTFVHCLPAGNGNHYESKVDYPVPGAGWWAKTLTETGATLLSNNSWGARGVLNNAKPDRAGYKQSQINNLSNGVSSPDVIIIKLGINDFNYGAILGTYDGSTALPTMPDDNDDTTAPTNFLDGYAIMLHRIMTTYPKARVYCSTLMAGERTGDIGFPELNPNGESIGTWNNAIIKLAHAFGAGVLNHDTCGITYYNLFEYTQDWDSATKEGLHPNAKGQKLIGDQTLHDLVLAPVS